MPEGIARICNAAIGPKARVRVPKSLWRRTRFHAEANGRVSVLLRPTREAPVSNPGAVSRRAMLAWVGACACIPARAQTPPAAEDKSPPPPKLGTVLPMTEVPLLDVAVFRPTDADGQLLVLYGWASWCPFCAQQTPLMEKIWQAHRTKGLRLLGLSIDRTAEDARDYMARRGYTFP